MNFSFKDANCRCTVTRLPSQWCCVVISVIVYNSRYSYVQCNLVLDLKELPLFPRFRVVRSYWVHCSVVHMKYAVSFDCSGVNLVTNSEWGSCKEERPLWYRELLRQTSTWNCQNPELNLPCPRLCYWNLIQRDLPTVFRYKSSSYHPHILYILFHSFAARSQENLKFRLIALSYQIFSYLYAHVRIIEWGLWRYFLFLHFHFVPRHVNTLTKKNPSEV